MQKDALFIKSTWSDESLRGQTNTKRIRGNLLFPETLAALPERRFRGDFVFTYGKGIKRHSRHNYLNKIFNTACDAFGLKIKLYEVTKHSFGTWDKNHGVNKKLLKEWGGHTSLKSTEIYGKMDVVDKFRGIMGSKKRLPRSENATETPPQAKNRIRPCGCEWVQIPLSPLRKRP